MSGAFEIGVPITFTLSGTPPASSSVGVSFVSCSALDNNNVATISNAADGNTGPVLFSAGDAQSGTVDFVAPLVAWGNTNVVVTCGFTLAYDASVYGIDTNLVYPAAGSTNGQITFTADCPLLATVLQFQSIAIIDDKHNDISSIVAPSILSSQFKQDATLAYGLALTSATSSISFNLTFTVGWITLHIDGQADALCASGAVCGTYSSIPLGVSSVTMLTDAGNFVFTITMTAAAASSSATCTPSAPSPNGIVGDGSRTGCDAAPIVTNGLAFGSTCTQSCATNYAIDTSSGALSAATCSGSATSPTFTPIKCVLIVQCAVPAPTNGLQTLSAMALTVQRARSIAIKAASTSKVAKGTSKITVPAAACATTINAGTSCSQICSAGYKLIGTDSTCAVSADPTSAVGVFTGQTCVACSIDSVSTTDGNNVCMPCGAGYSTVGQTGQSSCTAVFCPISAPTNGVVGDSTPSSCDAASLPNGLPLNSTCSQSCSSGYTIDTSPGALTAATCTNGATNPATFTSINCVPMQCAVAAPTNGIVTSGVVVADQQLARKILLKGISKLATTKCSSMLSYGSTCSQICNAGYALTGDDSSCVLAPPPANGVSFVGQSCTACAIDSVASSVGTNVCSQCASGTSTNGAMGQTTCVAPSAVVTNAATSSLALGSIKPYTVFAGSSISFGSINAIGNVWTQGYVNSASINGTLSGSVGASTASLATTIGDASSLMAQAQSYSCDYTLSIIDGATINPGTTCINGSLSVAASTLVYFSFGSAAGTIRPQFVIVAPSVSIGSGVKFVFTAVQSIFGAPNLGDIFVVSAGTISIGSSSILQGRFFGANIIVASGVRITGALIATNSITTASNVVFNPTQAQLTGRCAGSSITAPSSNGNIGDGVSGSATSCDSASIVANGLSWGQTCTQSCATNYAIDTSAGLLAVATCTGVANPLTFVPIACVPIQCAVMPAVNGAIPTVIPAAVQLARKMPKGMSKIAAPQCLVILAAGSTCTQFCKAGFSLSGADSTCAASADPTSMIGVFTSNQICSACAIDTVASSDGNNVCLPCGPGYSTLGLTGQISCTAVFCPISAPTNGVIGDSTTSSCDAASLANGLPLSSTCTQSCSSGYTIDTSAGAPTAATCTNGATNPATFTSINCVPMQCAVTAPTNGIVSSGVVIADQQLARKILLKGISKLATTKCSSMLSYGSTCSQICNAGYALTGDDSSCVLAPPPGNGVAFVGQSCTACGVDTVASSVGTNVCSPCASGMSTLGQFGQSACTQLSCTVLAPSFGAIGDGSTMGCDAATIVANGLPVGSSCQQKCQSGYTIDTTQPSTATCKGTSYPFTFTPITCIPITCTPTTPANGNIGSGIVVASVSAIARRSVITRAVTTSPTPCTSDSMSIGSTCMQSCSAGYQLVGASSSCGLAPSVNGVAAIIGAFRGQNCSACPSNYYQSSSISTGACMPCAVGTSTSGITGATACTTLVIERMVIFSNDDVDVSSLVTPSILPRFDMAQHVYNLMLPAFQVCDMNGHSCNWNSGIGIQIAFKFTGGAIVLSQDSFQGASWPGASSGKPFIASPCVSSDSLVAGNNVCGGVGWYAGHSNITIRTSAGDKYTLMTTVCDGTSAIVGNKCVPIWCAPRAPTNGYIGDGIAGSTTSCDKLDSTGLTYGSTCTQSCQRGYVISQVPYPIPPASCTGTSNPGVFVPQVCVPMTCQPTPMVSHGNDANWPALPGECDQAHGVALNSTCLQVCAAGYAPSAAASCVLSSVITGTTYFGIFTPASCAICPADTYSSDNGIGPCIACAYGTSTFGKSGAYQCTTIVCAPPYKPINGVLLSPRDVHMLTYNQSAAASCNDGYVLTTQPTICTAALAFTQPGGTNLASQICGGCPANTFSSTSSAGTCAQCSKGSWTNGTTGQSACIPVFCRPSSPLNGALPAGTTTINYGASVSATCNSNYALTGAATACGASGVFVQSQSCAPVLCVPSLPAFGTIGITSSRNPCTSASIAAGTSCDQGCVGGYSLAGSAAASCSSTGATGTVGVFTSPTCVATVLVAASTSSVTATAFAVDGNNNQYYVSGDAIMKLAPTTGAVASNFSSGFTVLFGSVPTSITLDVAGNVWAVLGSSKVTSSILVLVPSSGAKAYTFAKSPSTSSNLIQIKADPSKTTLYIVDGSAAGGILSLAIGNQAYSASGSVGHMRHRAVHTTSFSAGTLKTYTTGLGSPTSLVWSADGNTLYVAEAAGIVTVTGGGSTVTPFSTNVAVQSAGTIAIDKSGNVYVVSAVTTSAGASTIVKITPTGTVSTFLTVAPAVASSASSTAAVTLAFDSNGSLLVSGPSIGGQQTVTTGGVCTVTAASNGGSTTSSSSTGCGATLASGATCTQQCALGYAASSSIASCTGVAQFNPTVCTLVPLVPAGAVSVPIGRCSSFAALSGTSMTFAGTANNIASNNIGVTPGTSITGAVAMSSGTAQINSVDAKNCAADAKSSLSIGTALACKALPAVDMANTIITPGTWCSPTLMISAGTVTLDAQGNANSMFVFRTTTTITTAAMTNIVLINGASNANVVWVIGSSATLGASSTFVGTMYAAVSVTVGVSVTIRGRIFAAVTTTFAGSLTLDSSTTSSSTSSSSSSSSTSSTTGASSGTTVASSLVIGRCASFAAVAGTTITWAGTGNTVASNSIGVSPGTSITGAVALSSGTAQSNSANATNCATDAKASLSIGTSLACTPLSASDISGLTITPGTYCSATLVLSAGKVTLDAQGNANSMFVFRTTTTLITAASTSVVLINGATNANVIWIIGSSATLGASSIFVGTIYSSVSVTVGASASVYGRIYAQAATTFAGFNTLAPTGPASSSSSSSSSSTTGASASSTTGSASASASPSIVAVALLPISCSTSLNGSSSCLSTYSLLAGSAITLGATSTIGGTVGAGTAITAATNVITIGDGKGVALANAQALSLLSAASKLVCTKTIGSDITGLTFGPGVYCSTTGTFAIATLGRVTLAGNGIAGSQFIFRTTTTFLTGAGVTIGVTGTAVAADVVYAIGTALTTGANNNIVGSFVCGTAATVGATTNIVGRVSTQTAITLGATISIKTA